jgi:hypothetical protein
MHVCKQEEDIVEAIEDTGFDLEITLNAVSPSLV